MAADLKTFEATQADPAHCKAASFAAAGPTASHTGISFKNVKGGGTSTAGPGTATGSSAQLAERKRETQILGNL